MYHTCMRSKSSGSLVVRHMLFLALSLAVSCAAQTCGRTFRDTLIMPPERAEGKTNISTITGMHSSNIHLGLGLHPPQLWASCPGMRLSMHQKPEQTLQDQESFYSLHVWRCRSQLVRTAVGLFYV
jgi:hypothetical protein